MTPFLNAFDVIRAIPTAKRFEIGEMLFAQFDCPVQDEPLRIWSQTDHLVHVVSARSTWKTSMGMCLAEAGEKHFLPKGRLHFAAACGARPLPLDLLYPRCLRARGDSGVGRGDSTAIGAVRFGQSRHSVEQ